MSSISQSECARFLNTTSSHVSEFLKRAVKQYPFKERWDIKRLGGSWNDLTRNDVGKTKRPKEAMIITVVDDWSLITLFESIAHVADHYGVELRSSHYLAK